MSINPASSTAALLSQMSLTATSPYTEEKNPYTGKKEYIYNAPDPITIDASTLESALSAAITTPTTSSGTTPSTTTATPPWNSSSTAPQQSALVKSVTNGAAFFNPSSAQLAAPAGTHQKDYESLFALYQGLNAMEGLASASAATGVTSTQQAAYQKTFAQGLTQLQSFIASGAFPSIDVAYGALQSNQQSTVGDTAETDSYTTQPIATGSVNTVVPSLEGNIAFSAQIQSVNGMSQTVNFNLDDMGSTPRTLANVVSYLNGQLKAAGVDTRFADVMNPGAAQTATVNGKTQTIGTEPNTYSLKVVGTSTETVTFLAADSAPAVYLTGSQGAPGQTTTSITTSSSGAPQVTTTTGTSDVSFVTTKLDGSSGAVATGPSDGVQANTTIANTPTNVLATATGPDGSLYMVADIDSKTADGQTLNGSSDVALMKYDSAGDLQYTRTLGAANAASGYAIAVSPDGSQVAIAGTTTGPLDPTDSTQPAGSTAGFVSVFSTDTGDENWTQTQAQDAGVTQTPTAITFGSNSQVIVAGTSTGQLFGTGAYSGGQGAYIEGYTGQQITAPDGTTSYVSSNTFTRQFGSSGFNTPAGVAVSGNTLYETGVENGDAVVRAYTLNGSAAPTLTASQDLGSLKGGTVAGISIAADGSVVVAGSTENGALAGTVGQAYTSGQQGFVATLSSSLAPQTINYIQTASALTATSMTQSNGEIYLAGSLAEQPQAGQTSGSAGYVAEVDPTSGQVLWSRTQQGADGIDTPTSVAVARTGASPSLQALGLPTGTLQYAQSDELAAGTSVRPGDSFQVKVGSGTAATITIQAGETYQDLVRQIRFATGYQATVSTPTVDGKTVLKIAPANSSQSLTLISGPAGGDALAALGLRAGLITDDVNNTDSSGGTTSKQAGAKSVLGLVLPATMDISTTAGAQSAVTALQLSIAKVENLYTDMSGTSALKTSSKTDTLSPTLQTYYSNQVANYQLALQRLGGSS